MKLSLVFDPDPTIGSDPNDPHGRPTFEDGYETQVWSSGIWENVTLDSVELAMATIEELP